MIVVIYKDYENKADIEGYAKLIKHENKIKVWEYSDDGITSINHYAQRCLIEFIDPKKNDIFVPFEEWLNYKTLEGFRTHRYINKGYHSKIVEKEE